MKIALAQINSHLGEFKLNGDKISVAILEAHGEGAALVVFPEMSLFGYPAYDLLERPHLVQAQLHELDQITLKMPAGITAVFGAVIENKSKFGKPYQNVAVVAQKGKKPLFTAKQLLPSYDVFDDTRFFEPGEKTLIVPIKGVGKVAVTVCEDMWAREQKYKRDPLSSVKGVKLVINISASPFNLGKDKARIAVASRHAKKAKAPFIFVNQVGGQDEVIFDGGSFVLDKTGKPMAQLSWFKEEVLVFDLAAPNKKSQDVAADNELLKRAVVMGLHDFMKKTGQERIHLGLSGGIDSSLVACIAVEALGNENVVGILMPGPYSSEGSITDSLKLADNLKIKTHKVDINGFFDLAQGALRGLGGGESKVAEQIAEQNIQARFRAVVLMMYANLKNSMLLSTSNKSELATGYSTLYGDSCGGLMPIGDLTKDQVYEVARLFNQIPQAVFEKVPSAKLAPDQKDQDSLPPYETLDPMIRNLVEAKLAPKTDQEKWLEKKLFASEFKRWQAPPILRVTEHAFGRGRRIPIARGLS